jgi:amidophosphoribosyltransferase
MCGVFGVFGHREASNLVYLGLHALQHRGQESAGIVSSDGRHLHAQRFVGLVGESITKEVLRLLPGDAAIGHVRYSTTGATNLKNAQPLSCDYARGSVAVAHNGNLTNALELRAQLEKEGSIFSTTSDTEVIVHLIARARKTSVVDRVVAALSRVRGAWSLLFLTESMVIAARDPRGFRPLVMGRLKQPRRRPPVYVFASETCAFDLIGADLLREVEPGEVVVADARGIRSLRPFPAAQKHFCVFEQVYFARPDSTLDGRSVYQAREEMGRRLARESPAPGDVVVPVPDSGMAAAIGYARESGIAFGLGLVRSHYVGRTFIEPQDRIRHFGVRLKLSAVRQVLHGKRVVVVDDSIVRGTTSRKIVKMIRAAGAREVHFRVSSPPTTHPCFYGIDTPTRDELIGARHDVEEIRRFLTCDSLAYLSREGMMAAVGDPSGRAHCDACFSGRYVVPVSHLTGHMTGSKLHA